MSSFEVVELEWTGQGLPATILENNGTGASRISCLEAQTPNTVFKTLRPASAIQIPLPDPWS